MDKPKRSYYLPNKLIKDFDKECQRSGFVKERVVAAALLEFLRSDPNGRAGMFDHLAKYLEIGLKKRA
jgi:hypothetical protein